MAGSIHIAADFVLSSKRADIQESEIASLSEDFGHQGVNVDDICQKPGSRKVTFILTMDLPNSFNQFNVTDCCYKKPRPVSKK
jgi:hypothetical protein